jgi:hypothetical protein
MQKSGGYRDHAEWNLRSLVRMIRARPKEVSGRFEPSQLTRLGNQQMFRVCSPHSTLEAGDANNSRLAHHFKQKLRRWSENDRTIHSYNHIVPTSVIVWNQNYHLRTLRESTDLGTSYPRTSLDEKAMSLLHRAPMSSPSERASRPADLKVF